jgi:putative flippase GtrA
VIRWLKFNTVGIAGAVVQLGALSLFARALGLQYVVATMLAVEVAVLHNFAWHEAWTWRGMPAEGRWRRLFRFHVANGFVSIASNALFTWLFKQYAGLPLLVSNGAAITLTAILNFVLASRWVFGSTKLQRLPHTTP